MIPKKFEFLNTLELPKIVKESLKFYGLQEKIGSGSNPIILQWAKELGLKNDYTTDSIPWCGLSMAKVVKDAGYNVVKNPLWALNWENFGTTIDKKDAMLGDILTFSRNGGGHVAIYIAETKYTVFVLGGNQQDGHNITEINKSRINSVSRCPWKIGQPESVKKYFATSSGIISEDEK